MGVNTKNGFIEYRHIHAGVPKTPAVTIKLDVDQEAGKVKCSFATCNQDDNFSRAIGRSIADKRMSAGEVVEFDFDRTVSLTNNVVNYLNGIMEERIQPPETIRTMELARAFYYMDYVFSIREAVDAYNEMMKDQQEVLGSPVSNEGSQIILPPSAIIGA